MNTPSFFTDTVAHRGHAKVLYTVHTLPEEHGSAFPPITLAFPLPHIALQYFVFTLPSDGAYIKIQYPALSDRH
jgi:hypothetical protein